MRQSLGRMGVELSEIKARKQNSNPLVRRVCRNFDTPENFRQAIEKETRRNSWELGTSAWDLLASFMRYLKRNHITKNLVAYGKVIAQLAEISTPKELYLGVLEQYDVETDFRYIEMLNPALEVILDRYIEAEPNSCALSFETALATMLCYFDSFNLPEYDNWEAEGPPEKVFENLKCLKFIERCVGIIRPAATKLLKCEKEVKRFTRFKKFCLQFTTHLMMVMSRLDTDIHDSRGKFIEWKPTTQKQSVVEQSEKEFEYPQCHFTVHEVIGLKLQAFTMSYLWENTDWVRLHPPDSFISPEGMSTISRQISRGRANFLFFVLCRGLHYDSFPKVYSCLGLFVRTINEITHTLGWLKPLVIWKGFEFLTYIVDRTPKLSFQSEEIVYHVKHIYKGMHCLKERTNHVKELFSALTTIAMNCSTSVLRTRACHLIKQTLDLFCWRDRSLLLTYLFRIHDHSGLLGILISYFKDKLDEVLRDDTDERSVVFRNKQRLRIIGGIIFNLPQGKDTDLLANCDKLMSGLNLLRFLLIRDKANQTGIFDNLPMIKKNYVAAIRTDIEVTKELFSNELLRICNAPKSDPPNSSIIVNGFPLNSFDRIDRIKTIRAAEHTFDMMEVVAIRVEELMEEMAKGTEIENSIKYTDQVDCIVQTLRKESAKESNPDVVKAVQQVAGEIAKLAN